MKKIVGFTIIELMITLLIASILIGAGIPALSDFVSDRSLAADLSRFSTSITVARSEAITRGSDVVLCPTNDGVSCVASKAWAGGWMVFRDLDGDQAADLGTATCADGEDCVVRYDQGMKSASQVTADQNFLAFNRKGERLAGSTTAIVVCSPKARNVSNLVIAASGSVSIRTAAGVCP